MSGEEITFGYLDNAITFKLSVDGNVTQDGEAKKALKKLLFEIANSDGKKEISEKEFEMIKNLKSIFGKIGATQGDEISIWLDKADEEFVIGWEAAKKRGISVENYIMNKLNTFKINIQAPKLENDLPKPEFRSLEPKPFVPTEPTQADKNAQFNRSIQTLKQKYNKDELNFTQEVQYKKGKYLYNIAKEALQDEGIEKPTAKEINERIAQIALVNGIKDVNNVPQSKYPLKVGTGKATASQVEVKPEAPQGEVEPKASQVEAKPEAPQVEVKTDVTIKPDPDTTGWSKKTDAQTPGGVDLNYGTLTTYTKGEGDAVETKYVYEKDGIKVEAQTPDELKTKIETIKTALEALDKTAPQGETEEAKATRIQGYENAINNLLAIGTEQAVLKAQAKLEEKKADVSAEFYEEKTIAMLNSGNVALIEQMFTIPQDGTESNTLQDLVNGNPKIQDAIGAKIVELREKYNNSTITLDEQKILTKLDDFVNVIGISIAAKDAVVEVKDAEGNVTTPASAEVFEKEYKTDANGNSAYHARFTLGSENLTFKAKDAETLDIFLAELKAANAKTDEAEKTQALQEVFNSFALNSPDTELVKSLAENADTLKATAQDLTDLVNKSNLDVIYAIDFSHLQDVPQGQGGDNTPENLAKSDFVKAKNAYIEKIMADTELAKLPENAKYLERIKGVDIAGQQTEFTKAPDLIGYTSTTEDVPTGEKDSDGNDIKVTVTKYSKEGQADVYNLNAKSDDEGTPVAFYAESKEAVLSKIAEFEKGVLKGEPQGESTDAAVARKRENLNILIQRFEANPTKDVINDIILNLKASNWIDVNDPDAKALVQKLLLTRDADIVSALTHFDEEVSNALFENDPVALKTLAAMFKEIRDKEKLPDPDNKLTPEQIALKDVLDDLDSGKVREFGTILPDENRLRFDGEGNLAVHNVGPSGNNSGAVAANSTLAQQYNSEEFMNDPILSKDKQALATWLTRSLIETKDAAEKLFSLENKTVDAELLSYVDFEKLDMSAEDQKAAKDAYVAKAKKLFAEMGKVGDTEQLDPANARYLRIILDKIDSISTKGSEEGAVDPDKAVIDAILGQFFETTGEGENAVTTIKNFRRFTYEEMEGLAKALAKYGTAEQCAALANMITPEEMEDGQFVRAIEVDNWDSSTHSRYADIANGMTAKEDVLAFIDKMKWPEYHIPFDKIMEKFGNEPEVVTKLLENISRVNRMSETTRKALVAKLINTEGNVEIPEGVDSKTLYHLLPDEAAATTGENATPAVTMDDKEKALFKKIVESLNKDNLDELVIMSCKAKVSTDLQQAVDAQVDKLITENIKESTFVIEVMDRLGVPDSTKQHIISLKPEGLTTEAKKAVFDAVFGNQSEVDKTWADKAIANGWLTKVDISVGSFSESAVYSYGDENNLVRLENISESKAKFSEVSKTSVIEELGKKDGNAKGAVVTSSDLKQGKITKDNVVAYIKKGNKSEQTILNGQVMKMGVIERLDAIPGGPSASEMEVIPKALLEHAREKGLKDDESPLKELIAFLNDDSRVENGWWSWRIGGDAEKNDYAYGKASDLDKLMQKVINKLEE